MACDKNTQKIKTMFDEISGYYDFMNNFISFGTHYILKFLAPVSYTQQTLPTKLEV